MALARYLIDKSALARLDRDEVGLALVPLIDRSLVAWCGVTALEVLYSPRGVADYRALAARLDAAFDWLPTEDADFVRARAVQAALAERGRHRAPSIGDLLIAAVAERHRVSVLHYDADYDLIAEVTGQPVEWVVPRGSVT